MVQPLLLSARKRSHLRSALVHETDERQHLFDGKTARIKTSEQRDDLGHGQLFRKLRLLELNAEASAQRQVLPAPTIAKDLDIAGVGNPETFKDLDRCGFARAVGTEHSETLAHADLEVETGDGSDVTVVLDQATTMQRRF